jgi:hypothetical protein
MRLNYLKFSEYPSLAEFPAEKLIVLMANSTSQPSLEFKNGDVLFEDILLG